MKYIEKRDIVTKRNEETIEVKQYEWIQNGENVVEDIILGRPFEWATTNKV